MVAVSRTKIASKSRRQPVFQKRTVVFAQSEFWVGYYFGDFLKCRLLDPINSELNIFVMRAEHAIHFENMIFFGTYDYLQPYDSSNYADRLRYVFLFCYHYIN